RNSAIRATPARSSGMEGIPGRPIALRTNVATTESRSSSRAKPGPPSGNIENSRCTCARAYRRSLRRPTRIRIRAYYLFRGTEEIARRQTKRAFFFCASRARPFPSRPVRVNTSERQLDRELNRAGPAALIGGVDPAARAAGAEAVRKGL